MCMVSGAVMAVVFGVVLAATHYIGEHLDSRDWTDRAALASFAAGVTGAYAFIQLLPEHARSLQHLGEFGFFFSLFGFLLVHVTEQFIYRYEREPEDIKMDFKELHSMFLFSYYLAIGIVITDLTRASVLQGALFFLPVALHTAISSMALTELHEEVLDVTWIKLLVSGAVLIGVGIALAVSIPPMVFHAVLGLVTGMFLYVVIHDSLPTPEESAPFSFLAGIAFYSLVIVATLLV